MIYHRKSSFELLYGEQTEAPTIATAIIWGNGSSNWEKRLDSNLF